MRLSSLWHVLFSPNRHFLWDFSLNHRFAQLLCSFSLILCAVSVSAQTTYYWVGNGGEWKDTTHWSLSSGGVSAGTLPTLSDDVIFDANSFSTSGQVVLIPDDSTSVGVAFNTMDWRTVTNNPTFRIRATFSDWIANDVGGSLYFSDNMSIDFDKAEFYFGSDQNYEVDTRGHNLGVYCFFAVNLSYAGGGSSVTCNLLSDLNHVLLYVDKGTFVSNGHIVTGQSIDSLATNYLWLRNSSVSDFSNSTVNAGDLTITETATLIDDNAQINLLQSLRAAGQDFNEVIIIDTVLMHASSGNNTFQYVEILPGATFSVADGTTQTFRTLLGSGTSSEPITLNSTVQGGMAIIGQESNVELHYARVQDINVTGGATVKAFNSWDLGNNYGVHFVTDANDSLALVDLYNSTNGTEWINQSGWLTGPVNEWYGVTTDGTRVTDLQLQSNGLLGTLPPSIGSLTALNTLYLFGNQLSGSLPAEIGNLTNLTVLSIHTNQFSGVVPSEINSLANLTVLSLRNNRFEGAFPSISSLIYLATLRLDGNEFTSLPDFSSLFSITSLWVSNNLLTFEDLEGLTSIPGIVFDPQKPFGPALAYSVDVGDRLEFNMSVGGTANSYQWLKDGNPIIGESNDTLIIASASETDHGIFSLSVSNSITGTTIVSQPIYVSLFAIDESDSLALVNIYNALNGPGWVNNQHWLTGPVMSWYGVTVANGRVTELHLSHNNLSGSFPEEIGTLTGLELIELYSNQIGGEIPASIGQLAQLHTFYIWDNLLTGQIPPELMQLTGLTHLALDSNQLGGPIPSTINQLTNLVWLDLHSNHFSGEIPVSLMSLTSLTGMNLSYNNFTGAIPADIGNLVNLTQLHLNNNGFNADIPAEITNINGLRTLQLQWNSFTGIPDLSTIDSLSIADISFNNFTFEDIEPNVDVPGINYAPQKAFGTKDYFAVTGEPLDLTFNVGGSANSYQWVKNDGTDMNGDGVIDYLDFFDIAGATTNTYSIANTTQGDEGQYRLYVTSSSVPNLTLESAFLEIGFVQNYYWIGNGGDWKDLSHWSHTSGTVNAPATLPDKNDNVFFDANSFSLPGQVVYIEDDGSTIGAAMKTMDWRGVTNTPTFQIRRTTSEWIFNDVTGSLYFDDNMVLDFDGAEFYFSSKEDYEIDTRNHNMGQNCWLAINYGSNGISYPVRANVISPMNHAWVYVFMGTFDLNGQTFIGPNTDYPSLWVNGTQSRPALADVSNAIVDLGRLDLTRYGTIVDDNATITVRKALAVVEQDLNHVIIADTVNQMWSTNTTYRTLEILPGATLLLDTASVQTIDNLIATGSGSTPVSIKSKADGSVAVVSKPFGTVNVHYAHIQDVVATGGATFKAHNSWDDGNNSGWNFVTWTSDSLALAGLYQAMGGSDWTNDTNWLTSATDTWNGVSVDKGRVVSLDLPANNITGTLAPSLFDLKMLNHLDLSSNKISGAIPAQINDLDSLQVINLSGNDIEAIPASLSIASLLSLSLENNKLGFDDLEPIASVPGLIYAPQDSIQKEPFVVGELGTSVTLGANAGGSANQYVWRKDNIVIAGETSTDLTIDNLVLEDDAFYHAEVTNSILPDLTLYTTRVELRVSSLERDRQALVKVFNDTNGESWTDNANWLNNNVAEWFGVTVQNNRVVQVNLENNNLQGTLPADVVVMRSLTSLDLSGNNLSAIPDVTQMTSLASFDVSGNKLEFSSLIPNAKKTGINYANQQPLGRQIDTLINVGNPISMSVPVAQGNEYTWKRNNTVLSGANANSFSIPAVNRNTMGTYQAEVTNDSVPGLTLATPGHSILAVAKIEGKLSITSSVPAESGEVTLLRVTNSGGYDTIQVDQVTNGNYNFDKVVLDNYQIVGFPDTVTYPSALPTYYKNTIFWEEADVVVLEESIDSLNIVTTGEPEPQSGSGLVMGYLEEEVEDEAGRLKAKKRVSGAGVSVRRTERSSRGKEDYVLAAYVFTNDEGQFNLNKLPVGEYKLNIQYPGYPMDSASFLTINVGEGLESIVSVEALVAEGKITVKELIITHSIEESAYAVEFYPNPAIDEITVRFADRNTERSLIVRDINGRRLLTEVASEKENTVDVNRLPAGFYLINIYEQNTPVKTVKLTIR